MSREPLPRCKLRSDTRCLMSRGSADSVRIVADVHEIKSGIPELLEELGAQVECAPLPAADYAVGLDTLVERKRVLDLHGAVIKGRIWPQLGKLRSASAFPYLLVEGTDLDRGPLAPNAIRGVCLAAIDLGIALLRTSQRCLESRRHQPALSLRISAASRPLSKAVQSVGSRFLESARPACERSKRLFATTKHDAVP